MGVLNVIILFICVTQNIAITQNEAISRLPSVQPQIPTDPSYPPQIPPVNLYSAPVYSNVLYSITPKTTSSKPINPVSNVDQPFIPACSPANPLYLPTSINLPTYPPLNSPQNPLHQNNISGVPVNSLNLPTNPLPGPIHEINPPSAPVIPLNLAYSHVNPTYLMNPSVNVIPPIVNPMNPPTNQYSPLNPTLLANSLHSPVNPPILPTNPPLNSRNLPINSINTHKNPEYSSVNTINPPANHTSSNINPLHSPINPTNLYSPLSPYPSPTLQPSALAKPRENLEHSRNIPKETADTNKHNASTRYLKLSNDDSMYPVFMVDNPNYHKDVQYFQLNPGIYNYNSDVTYLLPYPTIYVNQFERRDPDNVSNTRSPYQETVPKMTNVGADFNNNRDTIYPGEYKSKEIIERINPEPKTTHTVPKHLPETTNVLMRNEGERTTVPHSVELKTQSPSLTPTFIPRKHTDNKEALPQVSCPNNPLKITDSGIKQNNVTSYENIIEEKNFIQSAKQREMETYDRIRSNYRPVYGTENLMNTQINQAQNYLPISNIPVIPSDRIQNHCNNMPLNSGKDTMIYTDSNKGQPELANTKDLTKIRTPNEKKCREPNPIKITQSPELSFISKNMSENVKTVNSMENTIDGILTQFNGQQSKKQQVLNPYNDIFLTRIQNAMNQPPTPYPSEKAQENENNIIKNIMKETKDTISLTNQNISSIKQLVNNDFNVGYRDLQKRIDKIKQQNMLPRTLVQTTQEKEQKLDSVIDNNNDYISRKNINTSQVLKNNDDSHCYNDALNIYPKPNNIQVSKDMPQQRHSSNRIVPKTQGFSPSRITKEFDGELDSTKVGPENPIEPPTAMDYQNKIHQLISKTKSKIKTDKRVPVLDSPTFYDKSESVSGYIDKIEKEPVNGSKNEKQINTPKCVSQLSNVFPQKSVIDINRPVISACDQYKNRNLVKIPANNGERNQSLPATETYTSYINPTSSFELYESKSKYNTNGIKEGLREGLELANDPFKPDILSEHTLSIQPVNQYERYITKVKPNTIEPKENQVNNPNSAISKRVPTNVIENNFCNAYTMPAYEQVKNIVNVQRTDGYYGSQAQTDYKKIESTRNTSPINISPVPIEPAIIPKPAAIAASARAVNIDQPRVYTRVSSSTYANQVSNHPDPIVEPRLQNTVSEPHQSIPYDTVCSKFDHNSSPAFESIINNIPLDVSNTNENLCKPSLSQRVVINTNPPNQFSSSIDEYTSLISSSVNNIGSVLVTNLLSTLNTNIFKTINSLSTSPNTTACTQILDLNLPLIKPEISKPISEVPLFSVIPPCVESPRYLPEPCLETLKDLSVKTQSVSKTKKISKSQKKSLETKPSISTITINVVPAVQQTTNDIIILI